MTRSGFYWENAVYSPVRDNFSWAHKSIFFSVCKRGASRILYDVELCCPWITNTEIIQQNLSGSFSFQSFQKWGVKKRFVSSPDSVSPITGIAFQSFRSKFKLPIKRKRALAPSNLIVHCFSIDSNAFVENNMKMNVVPKFWAASLDKLSTHLSNWKLTTNFVTSLQFPSPFSDWQPWIVLGSFKLEYIKHSGKISQFFFFILITMLLWNVKNDRFARKIFCKALRASE